MRAPGREVVAQTADAFFDRAVAADWEGMLALAADDMSAWQSGGRPRAAFTQVVPGFATLREKMGSWEYLDVSRIIGDDSFCEQHTVRFTRPDGSTKNFSACVVASVGADGRITRLDEYIDPAESTTWLG